MFLCAYRCMAAVQGRALILTVLCMYTHIQVVSTRALPSLPAAPECAQTELQVSFIAPKSGIGETKENHISLCLPKQGHATTAVQRAEGMGSHPPQL